MRSCRVLAIALLLVEGCASTPKQVLARRSLANELVKRGEWKSAFDVVQSLCVERPDDAEALMLRGIVYSEQKMLDEAEADLKQAVQLAPKLARAHSALAIVYDMRGRTADALEHHRRAVGLAPRDPRYLNNLGFSLFTSGRSRDAIPFLHEALRAAPTDSKVRNNLGFAYAAAGDLTRAAEQFNLAGQPAEAKNNLGWAYERRGALNQAYELYVEAVRLDPGDGVARQNLSRVAGALGKSTAKAIAPRS